MHIYIYIHSLSVPLYNTQDYPSVGAPLQTWVWVVQVVSPV